MAIPMIPGTTLFSQALFCGALFFALSILFAELFAAFYHRFWYQRIIRPRFKQLFPRCSIIVPCKGIPTLFEESVNSYLNMDYPDFEVIYSVESETDPAVPYIQAAIKDRARTRLLVAGLATECCQKNWNLLKAIEVADNPEIYVFADADIHPGKNWLQELVLPFSDPKVTATSGFRWMYAGKNAGIGQFNHIFFNNFLYVLFSTASFIANVGLWGGAMAIRRKDFESLKVADRWKVTAVDDISLAEIIMKNDRKSFIVPPCITSTDDALETIQSSSRWIERQMMFLKMYHTPLWLVSLPAIFAALFLIFWLPIALVVSRGNLEVFLKIGGGASVLFIALELLCAALYPLLGKTTGFARLLIMQPLLRVLQLIALARTAFTNTITWSGIKYRVKVSNGVVRQLDRPDAPA